MSGLYDGVRLHNHRLFATTAPVLMLEPPAWTADAVCASTDPELFYPEKGGSTREAKKICAGCPVTAACLQYALDMDERYGVYGGLSERERRRLRRPAPVAKQRTCLDCGHVFGSGTGLAAHRRSAHRGAS